MYIIQVNKHITLKVYLDLISYNYKLYKIIQINQ